MLSPALESCLDMDPVLNQKSKKLILKLKLQVFFWLVQQPLDEFLV